MTFPSDYKVVQIAGGNDATVLAHVGAAREILINTTDGSLHVMDGVTPGGTKVLTGTALIAALQSTDPVYLPTGTMELIEAAIDEVQNQRGWTPWQLKRAFGKLADVSTSSWTILNAAMPAEFRTTSRNVNDLNDAVKSGLYIADPASVANLPGAVSTANNVNVTMIVIAQSTTNLIQILHDRFAGGKTYTRTLIDSVWSAWKSTVTRESLLQYAEQTLSIADQTQARLNIGGASPPGEVGLFAMNTAPTGWLKANGAAVSRTSYAELYAKVGTTFGVGDGATTFNLPDLRGHFLRAWDDGRGVDTSRVFGSAQNWAMVDHQHKSLKTLDGASLPSGGTFYDIFAEGGASDASANTGNINSDTPSGNIAGEIRPVNTALLVCIKY